MKRRESGKSLLLSSFFQRGRILSILYNAKKHLHIQALLKALSAKKSVSYLLEECMGELENIGLVHFLKGEGYILSNGCIFVSGLIVIQKRGAVFLIPDDRVLYPQDIFIPSGSLNGAWARDKVMVLLVEKSTTEKRAEGIVLSVIERNTKYLVAKIIKKDGNRYLFAPLSLSITSLFTVDLLAEEIVSIKSNTVVLLAPEHEIRNNVYFATLITIIGAEENPYTQECIVKISHAIPSEFPEAVYQEIATFSPSVSEKERENRQDLRKLPFVTIDGDSSKDFDDAIFVKKTNSVYTLYVAIADVAHYVTMDSALDKEARKRSNSYYFPLSVEPMLPPILSNELCSLQPKEDRLVLVVQMDFTDDGICTEYCVYEAVISSFARLTYSEVEQSFIQGSHSINPLIQKMLLIAKELTQKLHLNRENNGSLAFETREPYFVVENNIIVNSVDYPKYFSNILIEECMLAANECIAKYLADISYPALYRVHPEPNGEKVELLRTFLSHSVLSKVLPKENDTFLSHLLLSVKGTSLESIVTLLALRTMMQARYSVHNEGHYGLQAEYYCHFTSPIRRYADLIIHRVLKAFLHKEGIVNLLSEKELLEIATTINRNERVALDAERDVQRRFSALFMKNREGDSLSAIISSISHFAIFVEFVEFPIFATIVLSHLKDDFYTVVEEKQRVEGKRTGKIYTLGDMVHVSIVHVSLENAEIQCIFTKEKGNNAKDKKLFIPKIKEERRKKQKGEIRTRAVKNGDSGKEEDSTSITYLQKRFSQAIEEKKKKKKVFRRK
ncbi:MAG: ribonuclease R [Desulfovibrionaceae bacterium]